MPLPDPATGRPAVAVVQHTAVCPPGRVGRWLTGAGCRLEVFRCHAGEGLPESLDPYAGLLVLGGEMGAHDDDRHPWLAGTRTLLARAVAEGVPTLGICLGLQLLAVACGGVVAPSRTGPQLGLRTVQPTPAAADDPLLARAGDADRPAVHRDAVHRDAVRWSAVHWNRDLVTTPPPSSTVLSTAAGTLQALRIGRAAWGVQFHPEVDPDTLRLWAAADVAAGVLDADHAERRLAEVAARDHEVAAAGEQLTRRFAGLVVRRGAIAGHGA